MILCQSFTQLSRRVVFVILKSSEKPYGAINLGVLSRLGSPERKKHLSVLFSPHLYYILTPLSIPPPSPTSSIHHNPPHRTQTFLFQY